MIKAEGGRVSQEFEERACARSSWRTPAAMQRSGPGSETKVEGSRSRFIIAMLVVATLAGCDYFGFTPIKDIVAAPGPFEGKEVKIKGKAANPVQLLGVRTFSVKDEGGEITVSTAGSLPAAGADVAVKGNVKSAIIVGGKAAGLHVAETQRLK